VLGCGRTQNLETLHDNCTLARERVASTVHTVVGADPMGEHVCTIGKGVLCANKMLTQSCVVAVRPLQGKNKVHVHVHAQVLEVQQIASIFL
jgi:hypothetical protein